MIQVVKQSREISSFIKLGLGTTQLHKISVLFLISNTIILTLNHFNNLFLLLMKLAFGLVENSRI